MFEVPVDSSGGGIDTRFSLITTSPPHKKHIVVTLFVLFAFIAVGVGLYPLEDNLWLTVQREAPNLNCSNGSIAGWNETFFVEINERTDWSTLKPGLDAWIFPVPGSGPVFTSNGPVTRVSRLACGDSIVTALEIQLSTSEIEHLKTYPKSQTLGLRVLIDNSTVGGVLVRNVTRALTG